MRYEEWERAVPERVRTDPLWSLRVYRVALYVADVATRDGRTLAASPVTERVAGQLVAAAGAIAAQIASAHSRRAGRDRTGCYESALAAAREAREWYLRSRTELGENVVLARITTLAAIARALLVLIDRGRGGPSR